MPEQSNCALWLLQHERLQVFTSHFGHLYLNSFSEHIAHSRLSLTEAHFTNCEFSTFITVLLQNDVAPREWHKE